MIHPLIPDAALEQHKAVVGKTGSGKTFAAKGIVEARMRHRRQQCIVDPTGAWWGMRLSADGRAPGMELVIIGGEHGDIPLTANSGAAVARLVAEQGASVVIDTSLLLPGEYTRWFTDFAGTLFSLNRHPLDLTIDEAHQFMPQNFGGSDREVSRMLHVGNRLMSGGRSRGIIATLITQRPAKLHKDALTCADSLIAMRVIAPQDRAAIKAWVDGSGDAADGRRVLDSLASLQRGEGWVWYPEGGHLEKVKFPAITTYDSSAAPKHGAKAAPKLAEIKLDDVRAALSEAVKEAEANDPKRLRARIVELERAAKAGKPVIDQVAIDRAVAAAVAARDRDWNATMRQVGHALSQARAAGRRIAESAATIAALPDDIIGPLPGAGGPAVAPLTPRSIVAVAPGGAKVGGRPKTFLDAAATLQELGVEVSRQTVCAWVGVHPRGGSVGEVLSELARSGLIVVDRDGIKVTDAGIASAEQLDPATAIDRARSGLSNRQTRIFDIVRQAHPDGVTREAIAEEMRIHPRGGSFGEDLARLRDRGLVTNERGVVRARDFLFSGGMS